MSAPQAIVTPPELRPLVICGPSAVGKGTLAKMLFDNFKEFFGKKISTTTRKPRTGEVHGIDYYFLTIDEFDDSAANNEFIETAIVHGNKYGTTFASVREAGRGGKIPLLELDIQGVETIRALNASSDTKVLDATFIWIAPPTVDILVQRLTGRGTETDAEIKRRLASADVELEYARAHADVFDHVIINDNLEQAFFQLLQVLCNIYPHLRPHANEYVQDKLSTYQDEAVVAQITKSLGLPLVSTNNTSEFADEANASL